MAEFTKEQTEAMQEAWQSLVEDLGFRENGEYTAFGKGETLNERNKSGTAFMAELQTMPPEQRAEAVRARLEELDSEAQAMQGTVEAGRTAEKSPDGVEYEDYQNQMKQTEEQLRKSREAISKALMGGDMDFGTLLAAFAQANTKLQTSSAMIDAANNPDFNDQERTFEKKVENAQGVEAVAGTLTAERTGELVSAAAEHKHDVDQARETRYNIERQKIGAIVKQVGRIYDDKIADLDSEYEIDVMRREKESIVEKITEKNGEYAKGIAYAQERIDGMNIPIKEKDALKVDVIEAAIEHKGDGKDFSRDYFKHNHPELGMTPVNLDSLVADSSKMMAVKIEKDGVYAQFAAEGGGYQKVAGASVAQKIKENGIDLDNWEFNSKYGSDTRRVNVHENLGIDENNPLVVHGDSSHVKFDGRSDASSTLDRNMEMANVVGNIKSAGGVDDNIASATQERSGQLAYGARKRMLQKMEFAIKRETELQQKEQSVASQMQSLSPDAQSRIAAQFTGIQGKMADIERYAKGMPKENNDPNAPIPGGSDVGNLAANGPSQGKSSERTV